MVRYIDQLENSFLTDFILAKIYYDQCLKIQNEKDKTVEKKITLTMLLRANQKFIVRCEGREAIRNFGQPYVRDVHGGAAAAAPQPRWR